MLGNRVWKVTLALAWHLAGRGFMWRVGSVVCDEKSLVYGGLADEPCVTV